MTVISSFQSVISCPETTMPIVISPPLCNRAEKTTRRYAHDLFNPATEMTV